MTLGCTRADQAERQLWQDHAELYDFDARQLKRAIADLADRRPEWFGPHAALDRAITRKLGTKRRRIPS